mgnify:CR=1 FL=1
MVRALRRKKGLAENLAFATPEVQEILGALDFASVIFTAGDRIEYYSSSAVTLGVIRDEKLIATSVLNLVRKARRTGFPQNGNIEVPRGPIGEGVRKLSAEATFFDNHDATLVIFQDESEAERVDAVRRDFVANISHELKTPISALRTLSEAVSVASTDPQVNKFASMMESQVDRLSTLVQEIIDLSRLQDADPLLDALQVDIDEAVNEAIDQCQVLAGTRDIEIIRGPYHYLRLSLPEVKRHKSATVSLSPAVHIFEQVLSYQTARGYGQPDDYVFFPEEHNRRIVLDVAGWAFNWILKELDIKVGPHGTDRTLYSLRHTAITFRLIYGGNIDLLTLARNARTSVEMIDKFYASTLSAEMNIALLHSKRR